MGYERMVLMNPGPVLVDPRVREALTRPDMCHREPEFSHLMGGIRRKVTQVCGGDASFTAVLFTGSGTAALEATLSSVVPLEGKVLVLSNGHYGERIASILAVHRIPHAVLDYGWATPFDLRALREHLARDPRITHVAMVHHETSTGMLNPLHEVGQVVSGSCRSLVVDAISSLGGEILHVQADGIDWCIGTANKCIEGVPGISFVCAPRTQLDRLAAIPARTCYLNLYNQYLAEDQAQAPPFTPAVQSYMALDVALDLLLDEGVQARNSRYAALARRLTAGLEERGLELLLPSEHRSNTLTAVYLPAQVAYSGLHDRLKASGFVIYAGQETLRQKVFRVANMGQIMPNDIERFLAALSSALAGLQDAPKPIPRFLGQHAAPLGLAKAGAEIGPRDEPRDTP